MELKPVSTQQKESLVTILIDNIPTRISYTQFNHMIEWIDRYHRYQIGMEIYPLESNIHKQYAIKCKLALETLKRIKYELQTKDPENPSKDGYPSHNDQPDKRTTPGNDTGDGCSNQTTLSPSKEIL